MSMCSCLMTRIRVPTISLPLSDTTGNGNAFEHELVLAVTKSLFDGFLPLLKYGGLGKEISTVKVGYLRDDMH